MITIVDSGVANLASVMAALHRLRIDAEITADAKKIRASSHVILPGVGSASAAMDRLKSKNLIATLRSLTQPVLGICLGMQLLFEGSEESGGVECLAVLPGIVKLLPSTSDRPVPHMGWNRLRWKNSNHALAQNVLDDSYVYFVHSYAAPVADTTLAVTEYGENFTALVGYRNFFGCQFHPERSSNSGSQILANFIGL